MLSLKSTYCPSLSKEHGLKAHGISYHITRAQRRNIRNIHKELLSARPKIVKKSRKRTRTVIIEVFVLNANAIISFNPVSGNFLNALGAYLRDTLSRQENHICINQDKQLKNLQQ